jgi:hypothetical protein
MSKAASEVGASDEAVCWSEMRKGLGFKVSSLGFRV